MGELLHYQNEEDEADSLSNSYIEEGIFALQSLLTADVKVRASVLNDIDPDDMDPMGG